MEDLARLPISPKPGRSLVTRRAVVDLVRAATIGSYGVTGFAGRPHERVLGRLGLAQTGIDIRLGSTLEVDLDLTVAYGVPVAEVARQVDSAIRYSIRHALGREVGQVTIHIDGLKFGPGGAPPAVLHVDPAAVGPRELADSGTDVA